MKNFLHVTLPMFRCCIRANSKILNLRYVAKFIKGTNSNAFSLSSSISSIPVNVLVCISYRYAYNRYAIEVGIDSEIKRSWLVLDFPYTKILYSTLVAPSHLNVAVGPPQVIRWSESRRTHHHCFPNR